MKLRITPLNILSALFIVGGVVLLLNGSAVVAQEKFGRMMGYISFGFAVVVFVSDLIFRASVRNLKRLWLLELLFMAITLILVLIFRTFR
jgi:hypothetical protein